MPARAIIDGADASALPATPAGASLHAPAMSDKPVFIYDTTLRDGTQGEGFQLSGLDKLRIARRLDEFGIERGDFLTGRRGRSQHRCGGGLRPVAGRRTEPVLGAGTELLYVPLEPMPGVAADASPEIDRGAAPVAAQPPAALA